MASSKEFGSIDVGRALEIVGIIGILVSLIFLGYELKRSNLQILFEHNNPQWMIAHKVMS